MSNIIIDKPRGLPELIPIFAGYEDCKPNHRFGPYIRESFLIHFCISGCGTLKDKYGEHKIGAGELFIIRPGEITVYTADGDDPWSYAWLGFGGSRAEELLSLPSVISMPSEPFFRLAALIKGNETSADIYTSFLYEFFHLAFSRDEGEKKLSAVKRYIDYGYMNEISVASIAEHFGFDRSYLFRIFKERYGMGIKEYLTGVRMRHAERFLSLGCSVSECATMSGYPDQFTFSRAYKKHFGAAPREHARALKN